MIVKRAAGCCEECGIQVGRSGHVHHLGTVADTPDTYNDVDMLRLLCASCHMSLHHPPKAKNERQKPKNPDAVALGRLGGKVGGKSRSEVKITAARENGKKGGRPKKKRPASSANI